MTRDDIERRLAEIREAADEGGNEEAHIREDGLYYAFIEDIADGQVEGIVELAELVLSSGEIGFARWYA